MYSLHALAKCTFIFALNTHAYMYVLGRPHTKKCFMNFYVQPSDTEATIEDPASSYLPIRRIKELMEVHVVINP